MRLKFLDQPIGHIPLHLPRCNVAVVIMKKVITKLSPAPPLKEREMLIGQKHRQRGIGMDRATNSESLEDHVQSRTLRN